ncbi:hypothetical protein [Nonomuraea candida]|uniref:hypothetical protein n=1 Tax=Nonomuraea candida TaxID=359159 RepID=UPI000A41170F|nr:hypothetical protein [Nonomuraea candida]
MAKREVRHHFRTTASGKRVPVRPHKRRVKGSITAGGILFVVLLVVVLMAMYR